MFFIYLGVSLSLLEMSDVAEASQQIFIYVALATHASSSHPQSNYWKEGCAVTLKQSALIL